MNASELLRLMAAVSFGTLIVLSIVFLAGRTAAMAETGKWARAYNKPGLFDNAGRPRAYVITYQEFLDGFADKAGWACHDFRPYGFLFDEQGVYGFADCSVGFTTPDDEAQYLGWCVDNSLL